LRSTPARTTCVRYGADDRIDDRPAVLAAFTDPETARWIPEYRVTTLAEAGE
jgi:hypothetical protein